MRPAGTVDAYALIRRAVVDRIEEDKLDPGADRPAIAGIVADAVNEYQRRALTGGGAALADPSQMVSRVLRAITEYGPLSDLLDRRDVEEIFIEGDRVLFLDGSGRLKGLAAPTSEYDNRQVVERMLSRTERHLDSKSPLVQARVLDGKARLSAAIAPVADRLSATLRKYTLRRETLGFLVERDSLPAPAADFLAAAVRARTSILMSGPPGAGKTSLLAAMIAAAPSTHCIRCCEEIRELSAPLAHGSYYEARPASLDGTGEISMRDLVKFVLSMRPDLIVVGEVRGAEAFELTRAVNAGCGFMCTIHANSARDALGALVNAAVMAGENVSEAIVRKVFAASIDFVVHLDRDDINRIGPEEEVRRQVVEILAVAPSVHDDFTTEQIFVRERLGAPLVWTGALPPRAGIIERALPAGQTLAALLGGGRPARKPARKPEPDAAAESGRRRRPAARSQEAPV